MVEQVKRTISLQPTGRTHRRELPQCRQDYPSISPAMRIALHGIALPVVINNLRLTNSVRMCRHGAFGNACNFLGTNKKRISFLAAPTDAHRCWCGRRGLSFAVGGRACGGIALGLGWMVATHPTEREREREPQSCVHGRPCLVAMPRRCGNDRYSV